MSGAKLGDIEAARAEQRRTLWRTDRDNALYCLGGIDPARLTRDEWLRVGMALKASGATAADWESWSRADSARFHEGECGKVWAGLNGSGVGLGTLVKLFRDAGGVYPPAGDAPRKPAPPPSPVVSFYSVKTDRTGSTMTLGAVLDGIRNGRWGDMVKPVRDAVEAGNDAAKDAAKGRLPGFTPGGRFTARKKACLAVHSGMVVADLDHLPSPDDAARVRDALAHDAHVVAAFVSPSGLGVKALVRVESCADAAEHEAAFAALVEHFAQEHGINLDTSGKDVSRLCFVSHDPQAFVREGAARPFAWRKAEDGGIKPLPMMTAGDLLDSDIPPRVDLVGEAMLYLGGTAAIVAPAGTGKTRALIQMACGSLVGVPFGPLHCPRYVGKWLLFCGNENSRRRYKTDLAAMLAQFGPEDRETIRQNLLVHVAEGYDDFVGPDSMDRVTATVQACGGDSVAVVAFDPTGDLVEGDANGDTDVRAMLRSTGQAVRRAARDACIVYVHHAREGRLDVAQATGWGRGNFSKGSKALHACVRAAFHLAPSDSGETGGVLVACGKCNDGRRFDPFGMKLEGGVYVHDADFDAAAWKADIEGKMRTRPRKTRLTDEAALTCLGDDTDTATGVRARLREQTGATRDDADDVCRRLLLSGDWIQWRPNFKNAPTYLGPTKAMERRKAATNEKLQKRLV